MTVWRVCETAQRVKGHNHEDRSLIPGSHGGMREPTPESCLLTSVCTPTAPTPPLNNKKKIKLVRLDFLKSHFLAYRHGFPPK